MGKSKQYKMLRPSVQVTEVVRPMPRAALVEIIKAACSGRVQDQMLREELMLMAQTAERIAWGSFALKERLDDELCGCAISNICDMLDFRELDAHPGHRFYGYGTPFTRAFDQAMQRYHNGYTQGIAKIFD